MNIFSVILLILAVSQIALFVLTLFSVGGGDPVLIGILMLACWGLFFSSLSVGKR